MTCTYRFALTCGSVLFLAALVPTRAGGEEQKTPARERGSESGPSLAEPGPELTLGQALEAADRRNLSIAAVRADIARAEAQLAGSWAVLLPRATGQMVLTHRDHEDTAGIGGGPAIVIRRQDDLTGRLQVEMPLIDPHSWAAVRAAREGLTLTQLTVGDARQALLLAVTRAFYSALTARSLIQVQESKLATAERHLDVARTRHVSGVGKRIDVIRAKGDLNQARDGLLSAGLALSDARDALGVLIGAARPPRPVEGPGLGAPGAEVPQLVEQALEARLDLRLQRARVRLAERQLDAAWMRFVPTLEASWHLDHQFTAPPSFGSQDRSRWSAFLILSVPLYNQGRYADLDEKRAVLRRTAIETADVEQHVALEVRRAQRAYHTASIQVETAVQQAELAREGLSLAQVEYASGNGTSLEVTDAWRTGLEADVNLATRRFEAQMALVELLDALGEDLGQVSSPGR